jgi:hypothetical protein
MEALWALTMPAVEMEKIAMARKSFLAYRRRHESLETPSEESINPL